MHDPEIVGLYDRLARLQDVLDGLVDGDATAPLHHRAEVRAFEVLHHEVRRAAVEHARVHHARDVLARDTRRGLALTEEAIDGAGHLARDRQEELERHALIELRVPRGDDDPHPAGAEHALDFELTGEDLAGLHRRGRRTARHSKGGGADRRRRRHRGIDAREEERTAR